MWSVSGEEKRSFYVICHQREVNNSGSRIRSKWEIHAETQMKTQLKRSLHRRFNIAAVAVKCDLKKGF
jgi:hypothetical protein